MNRFSSLLRPRVAQAVRAYSATPVARMAAEDAAASSGLRLNFATPHQTIYANVEVDQLIVPGLVGEYGVTAGHQPVVSELKPGVLKIYQVGSTEPELYFVSGGFALTHEDSVTDISAVEAVKISDLDEEAIATGLSAAKAEFEKATDGTEAHAIAQIQVETHEAMAFAASGASA